MDNRGGSPGTPEERHVLRSRREMIPTWVSQAKERSRKGPPWSSSMPGLERKGAAHAGHWTRQGFEAVESAASKCSSLRTVSETIRLQEEGASRWVQFRARDGSFARKEVLLLRKPTSRPGSMLEFWGANT